jgi:hypothetical protein
MGRTKEIMMVGPQILTYYIYIAAFVNTLKGCLDNLVGFVFAQDTAFIRGLGLARENLRHDPSSKPDQPATMEMETSSCVEKIFTLRCSRE